MYSVVRFLLSFDVYAEIKGLLKMSIWTKRGSVVYLVSNLKIIMILSIQVTFSFTVYLTLINFSFITELINLQAYSNINV